MCLAGTEMAATQGWTILTHPSKTSSTRKQDIQYNSVIFNSNYGLKLQLQFTFQYQISTPIGLHYKSCDIKSNCKYQVNQPNSESQIRNAKAMGRLKRTHLPTSPQCLQYFRMHWECTGNPEINC